MHTRITKTARSLNDFDAEHADNCAEGRGSLLAGTAIGGGAVIPC